MTTFGTRIRSSSTLNALDIGFTYSRTLEFWRGDEPHDLTQYDGVLELIVFDAANVKRDDFDLTVLNAVGQGEVSPTTGLEVFNKATVQLTPTGAAGDLYWHVVGSTAAAATVFWQLGKPAKIGYYDGGPTG